MNTKQKLFSALEEMVAEGQNYFARDLQAILRRMYPADRQKISEIMHPGKAKKIANNSEKYAEEIERRTYVYPSSKEQQLPVIVTSESQENTVQPTAVTPVKKKVAAEKLIRSHKGKQDQSFDLKETESDQQGDLPEIFNIPTPDGTVKPMTAGQLLEMKEDEIVALFGTLKELKAYLVGVMQLDIARSASTQTAVAAFKEQLQLFK